MPRDLWWGLPGPRRLLDRVLDDLEEGATVVLAVPRPLAGGWQRRLAVRRRGWRPTVVPVTSTRGATSAPLALLTRMLAEFAGEEPARNVAALVNRVATGLEAVARDGGLAGPVPVLLETDGGTPSWPLWSGLLTEWAEASRSVPSERRVALLAVVAGCPLDALPADRALLRLRAWRGIVDETDLLVYAADAFAASPLPSLQRRVAAAVAARLAGWDPDVIDLLATEPFARVLEPEAPLAEFARERGWDAQAARRTQEWAEGQEDAVGAVSMVHAAVLALLGDGVAVRRRVWSGEVGVLMPFLEDRRQDLLGHLAGQLRLPMETQFKTITDARDLELGHVQRQVERWRLRLPPELHAALPSLKRMRDQLAHLEIVSAAMLDEPSVLAVEHGVPAPYTPPPILPSEQRVRAARVR